MECSISENLISIYKIMFRLSHGILGGINFFVIMNGSEEENEIVSQVFGENL